MRSRIGTKGQGVGAPGLSIDFILVMVITLVALGGLGVAANNQFKFLGVIGGGITTAEGWEDMDLYGVDRVSAFLEDSDGNFYVGGSKSWKRDASRSWNMMTIFPEVSSLLESSDGLYAGTSSSLGAEIYKSVDSGGTWTYVEKTSSGNSIEAMFEDSSENKYAVTDGAVVYRMQKGGTTWNEFMLPTSGAQTPTQIIEDSNVLYMAARGLSGNTFVVYFYESSDGKDWKVVGSEIDSGIPAALLKASDGTFFLATDFRFYSSDNQGATWTKLSDRGFGDVLRTSDGTFYASKWDGTAGTEGCTYIYKSTDGETWKNTGCLADKSHILAFYETSDGTIYAGTDTGTLYSHKPEE